MDEYLIGAGAVLTAGMAASIVPATLHVQTDPSLACQVRAALIDFEGTPGSDVTRVVLLAPGLDAARFDHQVIQPLIGRRACSMADILGVLAEATHACEVHLFTRWLIDAPTAEELRRRGVGIIGHPLEAIDRVALVSGQRLLRWNAPFRAA